MLCYGIFCRTNSLKGGDILSGDIILKIREAEAEAEKIREAARAEARDRIKDTETRGKKFCAETEARATAENEKKLELIRNKADEMINNNREAAREDSKEATASASLRLRESIRYIIGGVMEECQ